MQVLLHFLFLQLHSSTFTVYRRPVILLLLRIARTVNGHWMGNKQKMKSQKPIRHTPQVSLLTGNSHFCLFVGELLLLLPIIVGVPIAPVHNAIDGDTVCSSVHCNGDAAKHLVRKALQAKVKVNYTDNTEHAVGKLQDFTFKLLFSL